MSLLNIKIGDKARGNIQRNSGDAKRQPEQVWDRQKNKNGFSRPGFIFPDTLSQQPMDLSPKQSRGRRPRRCDDF